MKGILFNEETGMLKSVLNGTKTMTRRLGGLEAVNEYPHEWFLESTTYDGNYFFRKVNMDLLGFEIKPRFRVGETVFVKEGYITSFNNNFAYKVDCPNEFKKSYNWKNPMFCGESASRKKLLIKDIRVERLQSISPEDCLKEGVAIMQSDEAGILYKNYLATTLTLKSPIESFSTLITKINGAGCWHKNEWVFVYSYQEII